MTAAEKLFSELHVRGVRLEACGDQLRVDAPRGVLTPEVREALVDHKAEIIMLLAGESPEVAWRANRMLSQIPDDGLIPSVLVANEAVEPGPDECLSCARLLNMNQIWLCTHCEQAKKLAIKLFMLNAAQRPETVKAVN